MTRKMVSLAFFLLRLGVKLGSSLLFHYLFGSIASMLMIFRAARPFKELQNITPPPPSDSCGTKGAVLGYGNIGNRELKSLRILQEPREF